MTHQGATADDWAAEYFTSLTRSNARKRRLLKEAVRYEHLPDGERDAREFASKTEQLTRYLRVEHTRKDATNGE